MTTNAFLKIFGRGNTMRVFDYLVDLDIDVSVNDICEGTGLSRKTVDGILAQLTIEDIINITRTIGKTQMFKLNRENDISKKLLDINKIIIKRQEKLITTSVI